MKTSVLIADDHKLIRQAWTLIISTHANFSVVAECSSGNEAVESAKLYRPDIVLMDINLPDMSGIEATKRLRREASGSKVIAVSAHTHTSYARQIINEGAMGYVTKTSPREELFAAMHQALNNKRYLCEETKNLLANQAFNEDKGGIHALSKRELEIIHLLKRGLSSKEIADQLCLSAKTIEVHRYNILKKLELKNTAALINYMHNQVIA